MIIRSYPKVNICFKITGFLGSYCEIASRFALVKSANLYDTIEIRQSDSFRISGNFDCNISDNTIFRAKEALKEFLRNSSLRDSAQSAESVKDNPCEAPLNSPASWCKKSESKGAEVPPADFLLEADKRGSPPKSEKRQLLARRGSGEGGAALLREKNSDRDSIDLKDIIKQLDFFHIEVDKKIPTFAGLGGGSSNAASYLMAINEILELNLSTKDLVQIASRVGADVSFFVLGFSSANVFGIGEVVESFSENAPKLEILTPPIQCSTKAVYDEYRAIKLKEMNARGEAHFYKNAKELLANDSMILLQKNTINFLNDLYTPACKIYPQLRDFAKDGYFFSGSGSSFFRLKI